MILNVLRLIGPHERYRWVIVVIVAVTAAIAEALTAWLLYLALAAISTPSADTLISMPLVPNLLMPLPHLLLLVAFLFIARSTI